MRRINTTTRDTSTPGRRRIGAVPAMIVLLGLGVLLPAQPATAGTAPAAVSVAAGQNHTCALYQGGTVRCWGAAFSGMLGNGATTAVGDGPREMGANTPVVDLGTGRTATAIAAGWYHTCAILDTGAVKCWGFNAFGQLGLGDTIDRGDNPGEMGDALPAIDLGTGRTATAISADAGHTCAILDDGTVKCWGRDEYGQLGQGDTANRGDQSGEMGDALPAVDLGTGRTASAIATGQLATCALLDDHTVKCWGRNEYGQLGAGEPGALGDGAGEMGDALPTVDLGTGRTAIDVTLGDAHTCALLDDHSVKCWGLGDDGELGLGDTERRGDQANEMGDALPVVDLGTGRTATAITANGLDTCAVLDNSTTKCWGYNASGQLGQGDTTYRGDGPGEMGDALPAIALGTGRTAVQVAGNVTHTCAVLDDGRLKCWGGNVSGQLGQGDTANRGDGPGEMGDALPAVDVSSVVPPATCDGRTVTVDLNQAQLPTSGDDVILGRAVADTINGLGGNDRICAGGGADTVNGGPGNDRVDGQGGNDRLTGSTGNDLVDGGTGADTVNGNDGADREVGGVGNDVLNGQAGIDNLAGGQGMDRLNGGTQRDLCDGGTQRDTATACEVRRNLP